MNAGKDPDSSTWFDKPMRWAQLTLVENDPVQYDPDFWLDYGSSTFSVVLAQYPLLRRRNLSTYFERYYRNV